MCYLGVEAGVSIPALCGAGRLGVILSNWLPLGPTEFHDGLIDNYTASERQPFARFYQQSFQQHLLAALVPLRTGINRSRDRYKRPHQKLRPRNYNLAEQTHHLHQNNNHFTPFCLLLH